VHRVASCGVGGRGTSCQADEEAWGHQEAWDLQEAQVQMEAWGHQGAWDLQGAWGLQAAWGLQGAWGLQAAWGLQVAWDLQEAWDLVGVVGLQGGAWAWKGGGELQEEVVGMEMACPLQKEAVRVPYRV